MAQSIAQIVSRFKSDVAEALSPTVIEEVCQSIGHQFRERVLTAVVTFIRFEPRVRKGRPKHYPLLRVPRAKLRQALERKRLVA